MEENVQAQVELPVKNTKEVVVALLKLSVLIAEVSKDGLKADDALLVINKLIADEALKNALLEAYNDVDQVKDEVKDISVAEFFEILLAAQPEIMKLIEVLKK